MARIIRLLSTSIALWAWAAAPGPASAAAPQRAVSTTLDNGIRVVVIPDRRMPVVTHMVFVAAGSAEDPPGRTGVAHYLEHLMFKGTARFPAGTYDRVVARSGGTNNAYTSADKTYYYEQILSRHLPEIMDINADRLAGPSVKASAAASELKVVLEERKAYDNDPDSVLAEKADRVLYAGTPYAHPVLGEQGELARLTADDAMAFHTTRYGPQALTVIVAGDADPEAVFEMARSTYGRLPARVAPPDETASTSAPQATCPSGRVVERNSRVPRARVSVTYLTPGSGQLGRHTQAALTLLGDVLQSEIASPLWQRLVDDQRVAIDLGAGHYARRRAGEFQVTAEAASDVGAERLERALVAAMERLRREGLDPDAIAFAKRRWQATQALGADDQLAVATHYGEELTSGRSLADIEGEPEAIAAVTPADIRGVLTAFVNGRCLLVSVLAPDGSGAGGEPVRPATRNPMGVR